MNRRFETRRGLAGYHGRRAMRWAGDPGANLLDWAWYQVAIENDASEPRDYEEAVN